MDNHQVLAFPVAVIAVDVVEVYPLVANKFDSTVSACMVLSSKQACCNPIVEFGVSSTPVQAVTIIGRAFTRYIDMSVFSIRDLWKCLVYKVIYLIAV